MCNLVHQHLCMWARYKCQTLATIPLFGHTKRLHSLTEMRSAALVVAVHNPDKATRISSKVQRNNKTKKKKKLKRINRQKDGQAEGRVVKQEDEQITKQTNFKIKFMMSSFIILLPGTMHCIIFQFFSFLFFIFTQMIRIIKTENHLRTCKNIGSSST